MEKKEGTCEYLDHELLITDLPGTYSLTAHSADEARQELQLANSAAGRIGHWLEPVLKPMGFDWRIGTALIGAFAAKEVFVSQLGIVYSLGEAGPNHTGRLCLFKPQLNFLTCIAKNILFPTPARRHCFSGVLTSRPWTADD